MSLNLKDEKCYGGNLHLIKIPKRYVRSVEISALSALHEVKDLFHYDKPIEILIFSAVPAFVIPELGIGARAYDYGYIMINLNFSRKDIIRTIKKELPSTLLHEISHIIRSEALPNYYTTLLERLVTEGIGSYVEKHVRSNTVPYILPIKNEQIYWRKAKKKLDDRNFSWEKDHSEWFFGEGKLPRWIGYRLGYLIVSDYMKNHKNTSIADLTQMKASEILKGSGY
ncbi:hypothetical protein IID24_04480 [Patescibacteria group bacterium]|nr:hypothetical protein [Patescibacteria group bacterium]